MADEVIIGTGGNDKIRVDDLSNNLIIDSGAGKDRILIDNVTGTIEIDSGDGNDKIVIDESTGDVTIDAGAGNDKIIIDDVTGDVTIQAGDGNDKVFIDGVTGDVIVNAGAGNDVVIIDEVNGDVSVDGGDGNDFISVSAVDGHVYIDAGAGNDAVIVRGVTGSSTIIGGSGNDFLIGGNQNDEIYGNDGKDTILGKGGDDYIDGGAGDDTILGGSGNDTLIGGDGNDRLFGNHDNDILDGGAGDDKLFGGSGNDTIDGGADDDVIFGDGGNDNITGGSGNDVVFAGSGDDTVNYVVANNVGNFDIYRGDGGFDTLNIEVDVSVANQSWFQQAIADFEAFLLTGSNANFNFSSYDPSGQLLQLVAKNFEAVNVVVVGGNQPPIAMDDMNNVNEGASVNLDLAGNDSDADDGLDLASIEIVSGPSNGVITAINADGTVDYMHDGSETTSDSFTYTIRDNSGAISNIATVNLTINPVNDAVTFNANVMASINEDAAAINVDVAPLVNAQDDDLADTPTFTNITQTGGRVLTGLSISSAGVVSFDAGQFEDLDAGDIELLTFDLEITSGPEVVISVLTIDVTGQNDAPIFNANVMANINEDDAAINIDAASLINASDADANDTPSFTNIAQTGGRIVTGLSISPAGLVSFDAGQFEDLDAGDIEQLTFDIEITSGSDVVTSTLTIDVLGKNDAPEIVAQSFNTNENTPNSTVIGTVLASDIDADDVLTYSITGGSGVGAFDINSSTGEIFVIDSAMLDFETMPLFTLDVTVTDNSFAMATATITINLNDVGSVFNNNLNEVDLNNITLEQAAETPNLQSAGDGNDRVILPSIATAAFLAGFYNPALAFDAGLGDDTILSNDNDDIIDGNDGNDTVSYELSVTGVQINVGASITTAGDLGSDTLISIENLELSNVDDVVTVSALPSININMGSDTQDPNFNGGDTLDLTGLGVDVTYDAATGLISDSSSTATGAVTGVENIIADSGTVNLNADGDYRVEFTGVSLGLVNLFEGFNVRVQLVNTGAIVFNFAGDGGVGSLDFANGIFSFNPTAIEFGVLLANSILMTGGSNTLVVESLSTTVARTILDIDGVDNDVIDFSPITESLFVHVNDDFIPVGIGNFAGPFNTLDPVIFVRSIETINLTAQDDTITVDELLMNQAITIDAAGDTQDANFNGGDTLDLTALGAFASLIIPLYEASTGLVRDSELTVIGVENIIADSGLIELDADGDYKVEFTGLDNSVGVIDLIEGFNTRLALSSPDAPAFIRFNFTSINGVANLDFAEGIYSFNATVAEYGIINLFIQLIGESTTAEVSSLIGLGSERYLIADNASGSDFDVVDFSGINTALTINLDQITTVGLPVNATITASDGSSGLIGITSGFEEISLTALDDSVVISSASVDTPTAIDAAGGNDLVFVNGNSSNNVITAEFDNVGGNLVFAGVTLDTETFVINNAEGMVVNGGAGNDTITGSEFDDTFVFDLNSGADTITNFALNGDANAENDVLDISAYNTILGIGDLFSITDDGVDTVINIDGTNSITLLGVADANDVTAADFIFFS